MVKGKMKKSPLREQPTEGRPEMGVLGSRVPEKTEGGVLGHLKEKGNVLRTSFRDIMPCTRVRNWLFQPLESQSHHLKTGGNYPGPAYILELETVKLREVSGPFHVQGATGEW